MNLYEQAMVRPLLETSSLLRLLGGMAPSLQKQLTAKAQKYTGEKKRTKAQVVAHGDHLMIRVWLDLGEGSTGEEARELTAILLGPNAEVGQHKLVPNLWVAVTRVAA
jgi:hypothetical protein